MEHRDAGHPTVSFMWEFVRIDEWRYTVAGILLKSAFLRFSNRFDDQTNDRARNETHAALGR